MKVRKASVADARGIAKVQIDSWRTTYRNIVSDEYLNNMNDDDREKRWQTIIPQENVYVVENENGQIVGFSGGGIERTGNYPEYKGELYAIYLLESYQRKGLGRKLVEPVVEMLKEKGIYSMTVMVLADNPSRYFYEALGAKQIGIEKIEIGGENLLELVYGWEDIREII
ncbi:GNAT family N-acetyltransferase [Ornithinibacillus scapharcae]|uniref:GNAT family N-acetyltransferase n=1 Tax=Ornithinibacillus scapharcae TaxID=1147159 RepID=UPI000225B159|nr:GNAT family N-acetyltransferase [Ornithinibacillus scapharcae]